MKIQTKMLKKFISILCAATMVASGAVVSVGANPPKRKAEKGMKNNLKGDNLYYQIFDEKEIKLDPKEAKWNINRGMLAKVIGNKNKEIQIKAKEEKKEIKLNAKKKEKRLYERMKEKADENKRKEEKEFRKKIEDNRKKQKEINEQNIRALKKKGKNISKVSAEEKKKPKSSWLDKEKKMKEYDKKLKREQELKIEKVKAKHKEHVKEHMLSKYFKGHEELYYNNKPSARKARLELIKNHHIKPAEPAKSKEEILLEKVSKSTDYLNNWVAKLNKKDGSISGPQKVLIMGALSRLGAVEKRAERAKRNVVEVREKNAAQLMLLTKYIANIDREITSKNSLKNHYSSMVDKYKKIRNKVVELAKNKNYKDKASRNKALSELIDTTKDIFEKPVLGDNFTDKNLKHCFKLAFDQINDFIDENNKKLKATQKEIEELEQAKRNEEPVIKKFYDRVKDLESIVDTEIAELKRRLGEFDESKGRKKNLLKKKKNGRKANNNYQDMNMGMMNNNIINNNNYYPNYMNQNMGNMNIEAGYRQDGYDEQVLEYGKKIDQLYQLYDKNNEEFERNNMGMMNNNQFNYMNQNMIYQDINQNMDFNDNNNNMDNNNMNNYSFVNNMGNNNMDMNNNMNMNNNEKYLESQENYGENEYNGEEEMEEVNYEEDNNNMNDMNNNMDNNENEQIENNEEQVEEQINEEDQQNYEEEVGNYDEENGEEQVEEQQNYGEEYQGDLEGEGEVPQQNEHLENLNNGEENYKKVNDNMDMNNSLRSMGNYMDMNNSFKSMGNNMNNTWPAKMNNNEGQGQGEGQA